MFMTKTVFFVALALLTLPLQAAQLPDEINHAPYHRDYVQVKGERDDTQSALGAQRQKLSSVLEAIAGQEIYIATLQEQNREFAKRIGLLKRLIPQREREVDETMYDLSRSESEISSLRRDLDRERDALARERRQLEPLQRELRSLANEISRQNQRVGRLKRQAAGHERDKREAQRQIQSLRSENQRLTARIRDLQGKEGEYKRRIDQLQAKLRGEESSLRQTESKLSRAQAKTASLKTRLEQEKAELRRLRSSGAGQDQISAQSRKVAAVQATLRNARSDVKTLQAKKRQLSAKVAGTKREVVKAQSDLRNLPQAIAQARSKKQANQREIDQNQRKLRESERALASVNGEIDKMERNIANIRRRHARLQNQENEIQQRVASISGQVRRLENLLASEENRAVGLRNRIALLRDEIRNMRQEIPSLERNIARNEGEIGSARAQVAQLGIEENETRSLIAQLEQRLAELERQTAQAYASYEKRKNLFEKYLVQAQELGRSQTGQASSLGQETGAKLAKTSANELGGAFGQDEGRIQAKLLGLVRGELDGYPSGYELGLSSQDSIEEGRRKGEEKGKEAVYEYVRVNLKPGYFEDHMQKLLQMPVGSGLKSNALIGLSSQRFPLAESFGSVPDLGENELLDSRKIKTPLDEQIELQLEEIEKLQRRRQVYSDPITAYVQPSKVPFAEVECSAVYKGVQAFQIACRESFKSDFSQKFFSSTLRTFSDAYPNLFNEKYELAQSAQRDDLFEQRFEEGRKVAFGQGEKDGKQDAFDQAYGAAYELSYSNNLGSAKQTANQEALREGHEWIASHPVLTAQSSRLAAKHLRGGERGELQIDLKNISSVDSGASGFLVVEQAGNIKLEKKRLRLADVKAKSLKTVRIPFEILSDARSGEKASLKARLELPGDKYQSQRIETVEVSKTLEVNPAFDIELQYDSSPKVKGLFSYYIHTFSATIKPVVEDLDDNYEVKLSVPAAQTNLVNFKVDKLETGVLRKQDGQKLDFSYLFATGARGKTVELKLEVFFKGELLDSQILELYPH